MPKPAPPADVTDGLYTALEDNGHITFILAKGKRPVGHVSLSPEHASEIAANALVAAREAFERARMGLVPRLARTKRDAPMIQVDGLAVGRCTIPDHGVLVVRAGIAELGFAIPKQKLRELGEALVKWSTAEDNIPQQSAAQSSPDKGKD